MGNSGSTGAAACGGTCAGVCVVQPEVCGFCGACLAGLAHASSADGDKHRTADPKETLVKGAADSYDYSTAAAVAGFLGVATLAFAQHAAQVELLPMANSRLHIALFGVAMVALAFALSVATSVQLTRKAPKAARDAVGSGNGGMVTHVVNLSYASAASFFLGLLMVILAMTVTARWPAAAAATLVVVGASLSAASSGVITDSVNRRVLYTAVALANSGLA